MTFVILEDFLGESAIVMRVELLITLVYRVTCIFLDKKAYG